ncbi:MAG TPA: type II toxin-antitoxin system RelE/ParE family toxin [Sphingomicrobium sp.]|nr:type II toxin-antitoxin system RelE/ParE family toxin [Sphingomicrobium sp.]
MKGQADYEVVILDSARRDLGLIIDYLTAHDSDDAAERLIAAFAEKVASLKKFPLRGGRPAELERVGATDVRQLLIRPYRLIYRVVEKRVFIMFLADGRRDMQALLERRLLGR